MSCDSCGSCKCPNVPTVSFNAMREQLFDVSEKRRMFRREHWPESDFIFLVDGSEFQVSRAPLNVIFKEGTLVSYIQHVDRCYGEINGRMRIGTYEFTPEDLVADDWVEVVPN